MLLLARLRTASWLSRADIEPNWSRFLAPAPISLALNLELLKGALSQQSWLSIPLSCFTMANQCIGRLWEGVENCGRAGAVHSVHFHYQFQVDSFHHQNSLLISYLSPPSPAFPPSHKRVIQPICYPPRVTCHSLSPTHDSCAHRHRTFSSFLSHFFTNPPSMMPSSTLFTCLSLVTVLRTAAWSVLHQFIPRCGPAHCQCTFKVLFLISSLIGTLYRPPTPCLPTCRL